MKGPGLQLLRSRRAGTYTVTAWAVDTVGNTTDGSCCDGSSPRGTFTLR